MDMARLSVSLIDLSVSLIGKKMEGRGIDPRTSGLHRLRLTTGLSYTFQTFVIYYFICIKV